MRMKSGGLASCLQNTHHPYIYWIHMNGVQEGSLVKTKNKKEFLTDPCFNNISPMKTFHLSIQIIFDGFLIPDQREQRDIVVVILQVADGDRLLAL